MGPIIISTFPSFPMCMLFTCMATSVYKWRSLACFQPCRPSYPPPSAPTHHPPSQPVTAHTVIIFSQPPHHSCGFSSIAQYAATICHISHYFPVLATMCATINISNSTILFPSHHSSILIAITIVGDRRLLHDAPLQCCSSTQDHYAHLPHRHRPSPTITTSVTKSFPLFKKTLSAAMEIHVVGLHQVTTARCMANQRRVKMVAK